MRKLVVKTGSQSGREFELKPGLNRVGRHPANDIQLEDGSVSSFHCELRVAEIAVAVRDLRSTNGTRINDIPIEKGILGPGDSLGLGQVTLQAILPEVTVALPEIHFEAPPSAAFLEDGSPACQRHRDVAAAFRCSNCEQWWCADCVRRMKRLSGEFLCFCPECSAGCVPMEQPESTRRNWLERIADTLRISKRG